MRYVAVIAALLATVAVSAASPAVAASAPTRATAFAAGSRAVPVAFRLRLGSSRSRGYGFGGLSRSRSSGRSVLHRIVKTAIWLYVLHLFFTHGGLSILLWLVIIGLVVSLVRRRRRRYVY